MVTASPAEFSFVKLDGDFFVVEAARTRFFNSCAMKVFDTFGYSVTYSDGLISNEAIGSITVNPVNDAPVANAGSDQTVRLGSVVLLAGSAQFCAHGSWPTSIYY